MYALRILALGTLAIAGCDPVFSKYDAGPVDMEPEEDAVQDAPTDACVETTWYADCDGDGIAGLGAQTQTACEKPAAPACGGDWVTTQPVAGNADCNDTRADVHPGAVEVCDGVDSDCDGPIDEDGLSTFFLDSDNDGHGNPSSSMMTCNAPPGYVAIGDDCNDSNNAVYPGRAESCDGFDNNCNVAIDEGVQVVFYRDADGDGHGAAATTTMACTAPVGYVASSDDCNDASNVMYPGRAETCDGLDNNCDATIDENVKTTFYRDADNDGFGNAAVTVQACTAPSGYTLNTTDCNDNLGSVNPNAPEVCFNGNDDNCSGAQDEAAKCSIACNWSGARWLSAGYDGSGADDVGAWATCQNGKLSYMQSVGPPVIGQATGTTTDYVDCNWGNARRWLSQGYDGTAAFAYGADLQCDGTRVTSLSWELDQLMPGQEPPPIFGQQLGCNWTGAIFLAHGIDGNCAPYNGIDVTCTNGHITGMRHWFGGTCVNQRL